MKKVLLSLGGIALAIIIFTGGMYASQLLTFTGTEQAKQTKNNSSEMLEIIKKVAGERDVSKSELTKALEQANKLVSDNEDLQAEVEKLEGMNAPGLVNQIKELKNTNAQLTTDLNARDKTITEKNQAYDKLKQERDGLQTQIDNLTAQLNEANNSTQSDKEEIARLEAELIKANEEMASVNAQSNADVEEARTYK